MAVHRTARRLIPLLFAGAVLPAPAAAQMFHLYLSCKGQVEAGGRTKSAEIDLALRDNNETALIQRSNVLPVGERMKYVPSQTHYTMVHVTPRRGGGSVYVGWFQAVVVWYPEYERWMKTRLSVDRQTGVLEGEMLAAGDELLGRLRLACTPTQEGEGPPPRF